MVKKRQIHADPVTSIRFTNSLALLLLDRELGGCSRQQATQAAGQHHTRQQLLESTLHLIDLQGSFDSHDPAAASRFPAAYMQAPAAVLEMALHGGLLCVLLQSGLCPVFDVMTGQQQQQQQYRRLGYLNQSLQEVVRSVVVNKHDGSVVTVSSHTDDTAVLLRCTATPAKRRSFAKSDTPDTPQNGLGLCTGGRPILEVVGGGGFVEFDDACSTALLLNTANMQYKVYDMASDYRLLFTLPATNTAELKLGSQLLLLLTHPTPPPAAAAAAAATTTTGTPETTASPGAVSGNATQGNSSPVAVGCAGGACAAAAAAAAAAGVEEGRGEGGWLGRGGSRRRRGSPHLMVYAAANGQRLAEHVLLLPPQHQQPRSSCGSPFDVLELCGDKLLLKLPLHPFEVYDVLSMRLCGWSSHEHLSQVSAFLHLAPQGLFMTVCGHTLTTWDFKAQMVAQFEDHELWYPGLHNTNTVYITDQWVVALCRAKGSGTHLPSVNEPASIHISSLSSGRLLAAVAAPHSSSGSSGGGSSSAEGGPSQECVLDSAVWDDGLRLSPGQRVARALTDITSLLFVEEGHCIYTGHQQGQVHVWAPGKAAD